MEDGKKVNTDADEKVVEESDEEVAQHQLGIAILLNSDRTSEKLSCDLTLTSEGREFQVNKCVMMLTCEFFKKMFTVEMKEKYLDNVLMDNIPADRLSDIIDFIYTGKIKITEENVINFLDDAEYLQLPTLNKRCTNFLLKIMSADNCLKLRAYAKKYNLDAVMDKVNVTIKANFMRVVHSNDFMELDVEEISIILNKRGKHDEEAAFEGILKWVEHDVNQRKEIFPGLFSQIDFSEMTSVFLTTVAKEVLVRENLSCLSLFVDGILKTLTSDGDKLLIVGGEYTKNDCTIYNVITRKFHRLPNLSLGRVGATAVNVRGRVYVIGGANSKFKGTVYRSCEKLDINQPTAWSVMPDTVIARKWCGSDHVNGFIYATGGWNKVCLDSCERFDLVKNVWMSVSNMQQARRDHGVAVCNDSLYCIGGHCNSQAMNSCECLSLDKNIWTGIAPLNECRNSLACLELGGMIYAIGGSNGKSVLSTVEKYNPESNEWKAVASMQRKRMRHGACVLGGKIFVVGGNDGTQDIRSVEVYEPTSDTWTICFDVEQPVYGACVVGV